MLQFTIRYATTKRNSISLHDLMEIESFSHGINCLQGVNNWLWIFRSKLVWPTFSCFLSVHSSANRTANKWMFFLFLIRRLLFQTRKIDPWQQTIDAICNRIRFHFIENWMKKKAFLFPFKLNLLLLVNWVSAREFFCSFDELENEIEFSVLEFKWEPNRKLNWKTKHL